MNPPSIDVLIRSPRKTISLIIEEDGRLVVRASQRMTHKAIEEIVHQKAKWVLAKQVLARTRLEDRRSLEYRQGERFWFLGRQYTLALVDSPTEPLRLKDMFYLDRARLPRAGKTFESWYHEQARQIIPQRVQLFSSQMDHPVLKIRIKDARSRWGSCGRSNTLNFNWRLVMAPLEVIDYVVAHELAHLAEKNHSPRFWARVAALLPDYPRRKAWLKTNGHYLMRDYGSGSKAGG